MAITDCNTPEVWKAIPDCVGYEVSDQGRVRSYNIGRGKPKISDTPHLVAVFPAKNGRPSCAIQDKRMNVHRLVLLAFVGPCPPGMECCHKDDDKTNNRLTNLEWNFKTKNRQDETSRKREARGEKHGGAKLTDEIVRDMRHRRASGETVSEIAKRYRITDTHARRILTGKSWKHVH